MSQNVDRYLIEQKQKSCNDMFWDVSKNHDSFSFFDRTIVSRYFYFLLRIEPAPLITMTHSSPCVSEPSESQMFVHT